MLTKPQKEKCWHHGPVQVLRAVGSSEWLGPQSGHLEQSKASRMVKPPLHPFFIVLDHVLILDLHKDTSEQWAHW